ncbi:MAG TPA: M28 family peptidase [Phycisphaerales bacterium]|nr:M28 family peptidase [Phycisphaerales bacterium]HMP37765.1 M28 family peptidase [Phycisphaerales bacterium]
MRLRLLSKAALIRLAALAVALAALLAGLYAWSIAMPGNSHRGDLPAATAEERLLASRLADDLDRLVADLGPRNRGHPDAYFRSAAFIEQRLRTAGMTPIRHPSPAGDPALTPGNIVVEWPRRSDGIDEIVIIGAHYDSFDDAPGANDNGSGVVALLALVDRLAGLEPRRTLRAVFFVDEEPPWFQTEEMGSLVYARACRAADEPIVAMLSLETIGWFDDAPGSQRYPAPLGSVYPDRGDFVAFVANMRSRRLLRDVVATFRATTAFPSEGGALPGSLPGIGWSDHWAFWQAGYPGIMITDTAPFRYPHYHTPQDTVDKVDTLKLARITLGVERVLRHLVDRE